MINWAIEAGAPNGLLRRGFNTARATEVVVEGWQAKDGSLFRMGRNCFWDRRERVRHLTRRKNKSPAMER